MDFVLTGGRVIDPASGVDDERDVAITGGVIAIEPGPDARFVDCTGLLVLPGFIDLHVHLREPGEEHKETIATGMRAAAAGGYTSIVAMPNTRPVCDNAAVVELVRARAAAGKGARVYVAGAISRGSEGHELAEYGELKRAGVVCLTDDGKPVVSGGLMRRALEYAGAFGLPVAVHAEDPDIAANGVMHEGAVSTRLGLRGRPAAAEAAMVARDLLLAELAGARLHVMHVSTASAVRLIRDAKARGVRVTAEAAPHHLALTDEAVAESGYDPRTKMAPPLRSESDRRALVEGLADGTIDCVATDHAPHATVDKEVEFEAAANGVVGLETALPVLLELWRSGAVTLPRLVDALTAAPARAFGLPGGSLAPGAPADVVVVDPESEWDCDPALFFSKGRNCPWLGRRFKGRATLTLVGGELVHGAAP